MSYSALLMWLHDLYRGINSGNSNEQKILDGRQTEEISRMSHDAQGYLDRIQALATTEGFQLTIVAIPVSMQINHPFKNEIYQSILQDYLGSKNVEFIDLLPSFQKDYQQYNRVPIIPFDGHYDAHGNEIMAATIAKDHLRCTF